MPEKAELVMNTALRMLKNVQTRIRSPESAFVKIGNAPNIVRIKELYRLKQNLPPIFNKERMYEKVHELNVWYTRLIRLDEVNLAQKKVEEVEKKLLIAQENRREIGKALVDVRQLSNRLQDELHKVKRQENLQKFLDLMKEETEVLKSEEDLTSRFNQWDKEERETFTLYTNAVRNSHEKQRSQLEYTKYFGLILGLVGSFVTFCYATFKRNDLKRLIDECFVVNSSIVDRLEGNQEKLGRIEQMIGAETSMLQSLKPMMEKIQSSVANPFNNVQKQGQSLREKTVGTLRWVGQPLIDKAPTVQAESYMKSIVSYVGVAAIAVGSLFSIFYK